MKYLALAASLLSTMARHGAKRLLVVNVDAGGVLLEEAARRGLDPVGTSDRRRAVDRLTGNWVVFPLSPAEIDQVPETFDSAFVHSPEGDVNDEDLQTVIVRAGELVGGLVGVVAPVDQLVLAPDQSIIDYRPDRRGEYGATLVRWTKTEDSE